MRNRVTCLGFTMLLLVACKSSQEPNAPATTTPPLLAVGSFHGTYTIIHDYSTSTPRTETGAFDLSIDGDRYRIVPQKRYYPPSGQGAIMQAYNSQTIVFDDQGMHTAEFDWSLIIDGEFLFTADRGTVVLEKYDAERDRLQRLEIEEAAADY